MRAWNAPDTRIARAIARTPREPPSPADRERTLRSLQRLGRLLDSSIRVPGTNFRFGLDPLIGLVPGAGDVATLGLSAYIVWQAWRLGASRGTLARMAGNLAIDGLIGTIPLVGDLFDFAFKANQRNLRLLGVTPSPASEAPGSA